MENNENIAIYILIDNGYPQEITQEEYKKFVGKNIYNIYNDKEKIYIIDKDQQKTVPVVRFLLTGQVKKRLWLIILMAIIFGLIAIFVLYGLYGYFVNKDSETPQKNTQITNIQTPVKIEEKTEEENKDENINALIENATTQVKNENLSLKNELDLKNQLYFCESDKSRITFDLSEEQKKSINLQNLVDNMKNTIDICKQDLQSLQKTPVDELIYSLGYDIYQKCQKTSNSEAIKDNCEQLFLQYMKNKIILDL